ncbi:MAG: site-specific integrase [Firmicutes bacterium]|nr:site-specific integrase [Bacillota bacterium]
MNTVQPIRDINLVNDIADYLRARSERDYVLFMFGIYCGLRISDILTLRVRDVKDKQYIYLYEQKTNKEKRFKLQEDIREILTEYIAGKEEYEYLFKSREGLNQPITRQRAYQILNNAAKAFGLSSIGAHSLRKTFGYFLYLQSEKDIVAVKEILGHSDISTTLRYIGIIQDTKDQVMNKLSFRRRR